jgi:hypothetical protein
MMLLADVRYRFRIRVVIIDKIWSQEIDQESLEVREHNECCLDEVGRRGLRSSCAASLGRSEAG